jgi:hypothetical protein
MSSQKVWAEDGTSIPFTKRLMLRVAIGATGAPGAYTDKWGFGATPLTRTGVGVYTVALGDRYVGGLTGYAANTIQSTIAAGDGVAGIVTADNSNASPPTLTITMIASNTGVAGEIRNGATLLMELAFKDSAAVI